MKMNYRLLKLGDNYGRTGKLTVDRGPMVEIYDAGIDDPETPDMGQFVSRYYCDTFMNIDDGLNLHGGVPAWFLTAEQVIEVQQAITEAGL